MRKIREALRMRANGATYREVAVSLKMSESTALDYVRRAQVAGVSWPIDDEIDDEALEARLFPPSVATGVAKPAADWSYVHKELKRKGATLQLLWIEYKSANPAGYQYTQFCHHYRQFAAALPVTARIKHKAGEKCFVDYAGMTLPIVDQMSGKTRSAEVFVGTLGASSFIFAEATWTQSLADWCASHCRMYEAFGGVPAITVPDNLKSGVTHPSYYDPDINPTYAELAAHYGTVIIPARV